MLLGSNKKKQKVMFGVPVDREVMLTNHKNVQKKGTAKRQRKLVEKITFIKPFIKDDEQVLLVTKGYSPATTFEKYIIGWFFIYLKRSLFVFTNQRIFHVPTTPIYSYRNSIAQILYSGCKSITMKGRSLVVEYAKHAEQDKFFWISGKEKKKIRELLKTVIQVPKEGEASERTHLCPGCTNALSKDKYICEHCGIKFKTKIATLILSILFPGGGYFYTRRYFLGIIVALVEIILLAFIGQSLVNIQNEVGGSIYMLLISGLVLLVEKTAIIVHTNDFIKEFKKLQSPQFPFISSLAVLLATAPGMTWIGP
jgi:predicted tellurium resistance membrane protein TerC